MLRYLCRLAYNILASTVEDGIDAAVVIDVTVVKTTEVTALGMTDVTALGMTDVVVADITDVTVVDNATLSKY